MKEKKKLVQDPDVKKEPGTQPKKYYKTLSKDVKQKRADFFKKQDTTKPGYKPAPGDDTAKTKTSKHTKKFRQMYGEVNQESKGDYVISVKGKEMFRSKSDKDARSAFHKLVNKHGLNNVKVEIQERKI